MTRAPFRRRDLDRGVADAAARGLDDDGLAGLQPRAGHDHVPCGREHDLPGGGHLGGHAVGQEVRRVRGRDDLLGVAAGELHAHHPRVQAQVRLPGAAVAALVALDLVLRPDAVADGQVLDALADRVDRPGELDAELVRQRQRPARHAGAQVDVEVVDPAGLDRGPGPRRGPARGRRRPRSAGRRPARTRGSEQPSHRSSRSSEPGVRTRLPGEQPFDQHVAAELDVASPRGLRPGGVARGAAARGARPCSTAERRFSSGPYQR